MHSLLMGRYPRFYRQLCGEFCYPSVLPWPSDLRPAGSGPGFPGTSFFLYLFASANAMLHRDQSRNVEGNADLLPAGQILASHRPLLLTMQIPPSECFRARAGPSCPKGLSCSWFLFRGELASASSFSGRFRVRSPSHPLGWPRTSRGAGFRQLLLRTLPRPGPELPSWVTRVFFFRFFPFMLRQQRITFDAFR